MHHHRRTQFQKAACRCEANPGRGTRHNDDLAGQVGRCKSIRARVPRLEESQGFQGPGDGKRDGYVEEEDEGDKEGSVDARQHEGQLEEGPDNGRVCQKDVPEQGEDGHGCGVGMVDMVGEQYCVGTKPGGLWEGREQGQSGTCAVGHDGNQAARQGWTSPCSRRISKQLLFRLPCRAWRKKTRSGKCRAIQPRC